MSKADNPGQKHYETEYQIETIRPRPNVNRTVALLSFLRKTNRTPEGACSQRASTEKTCGTYNPVRASRTCWGRNKERTNPGVPDALGLRRLRPAMILRQPWAACPLGGSNLYRRSAKTTQESNTYVLPPRYAKIGQTRCSTRSACPWRLIHSEGKERKRERVQGGEARSSTAI